MSAFKKSANPPNNGLLRLLVAVALLLGHQKLVTSTSAWTMTPKWTSTNTARTKILQEVDREMEHSKIQLNRRQALLSVPKAAAQGLVVATVAATTSATRPSVAMAEDEVSNLQDGPRGLKYVVLEPGEGDKPVRGQRVYTKYTLWTGGFGGKQVDSNTGFLGRPLPVIVGVGNVIKGWDSTLLDMQVGETRRIVVPSDIGYGDKGAGGSIPPKATLYFEVQVTGMDSKPNLNDAQTKWLEEHPI